MTIELKKNTSETEIDLVSIFFLLWKHWRFILIFTFCFTIIGILYAAFATPTYEAKALVQIEQKNNSPSLLDDLDSMLAMPKPLADTEIEIIRSRMNMSSTIKELGLDIDVMPKVSPVLGAIWNALFDSGNKQVAISRLTVPDELLDISLELKIIDSKHYQLSHKGKVLLSGIVGQPASANRVSLLVSDIEAPPGTIFSVKKLSILKVIDNLSRELSVEEKGKDTGILELRLEGSDPVLIQAILNKITYNYLQQNVDRTSEEAARSLSFLKVKLPEIRTELDKAETRLSQYRQSHDSIDLTLEAKSLLAVSVALENQLNELTFKEAEVSKLFTKRHPAYRALLEKRQILLKERDNLNQRINALPSTQQQIVNLQRDVEANHAIFMTLLTKQQELGIVKASVIGNVRIIDDAMTAPDPIKPKKIIAVIAAFLFGFVLSSGYILLRNVLRRTIENVEQIEDLGINVYASIPLSDWQIKSDTQFKRNPHKHSMPPPRSNQLVSAHCPSDLSVESLRSLRTSLYFAMMEAKNKILTISGCTPGIGKTFIATNLAVVLADTGKKILLIDSDMRKGYLHDLMQVKSDKGGLSEYLSGQKEVKDIIYNSGTRLNLDFIPHGQIPPNPSELLMHSRLPELLDWANDKYDLILVDTPPVLAVTDASIISRYAGTVMMVVRYGYNSVKEIEFGIQRFAQNNIDVKGIIFNGVVKTSDYYRYGFEYK